MKALILFLEESNTEYQQIFGEYTYEYIEGNEMIKEIRKINNKKIKKNEYLFRLITGEIKQPKNFKEIEYGSKPYVGYDEIIITRYRREEL